MSTEPSQARFFTSFRMTRLQAAVYEIYVCQRSQILRRNGVGMFNLLLIGIGGFFGAICRYALQGWAYRFFDAPWIPYGTLTVNVVGCLLIGFLNGMAEFRQVLNPEMRLILFLGFLGGFTTYSTFGYETFALARDQQILAALTNIGLQVVLGLGAVWLGHVLARLL